LKYAKEMGLKCEKPYLQPYNLVTSWRNRRRPFQRKINTALRWHSTHLAHPSVLLDCVTMPALTLTLLYLTISGQDLDETENNS
jgi:hypothetical protein